MKHWEDWFFACGLALVLIGVPAFLTVLAWKHYADPCAEYVDVVRQEVTTTGETANVRRTVCLRWKAK